MNLDPLFLFLGLAFFTRSVVVLRKERVKKNGSYLGNMRRSYDAWERSRKYN